MKQKNELQPSSCATFRLLLCRPPTRLGCFSLAYNLCVQHNSTYVHKQHVLSHFQPFNPPLGYQHSTTISPFFRIQTIQWIHERHQRSHSNAILPYVHRQTWDIPTKSTQAKARLKYLNTSRLSTEIDCSMSVSLDTSLVRDSIKMLAAPCKKLTSKTSGPFSKIQPSYDLLSVEK